MYIYIINNNKNILAMTINELRTLANDNDRIKVILENEWVIGLNKGYNSFTVWNEYNPDKYNYFNNSEDAIKFFMGKVSYMKSSFAKKSINRELEINIL